MAVWHQSELGAFVEGWQAADRRPIRPGESIKRAWTDCPYGHSGCRTRYWEGFLARYLCDFEAIELALDLIRADSVKH